MPKLASSPSGMAWMADQIVQPQRFSQSQFLAQTLPGTMIELLIGGSQVGEVRKMGNHQINPMELTFFEKILNFWPWHLPPTPASGILQEDLQGLTTQGPGPVQRLGQAAGNGKMQSKFHNTLYKQ